MPIGVHSAAPASDPLAALVRRVMDLERQVRELAPAKTLANATIGGGAGAGIRTADFDGGSFAEPGTTGNYFGADGLVANSLYLRPGSVSNDMLTSPAAFGRFNGWANVPLTASTSTLFEVFSGTINVPAGYGQALLLCSAAVAGTNSTGAADNLYCAAAVNGTHDVAIAQGVANGYGGSVPSTYSASLTGLSGGVIRVSAYAATDAAGWTGGNGHVSAIAIFLR